MPAIARRTTSLCSRSTALTSASVHSVMGLESNSRVAAFPTDSSNSTKAEVIAEETVLVRSGVGDLNADEIAAASRGGNAVAA